MGNFAPRAENNFSTSCPPPLPKTHFRPAQLTTKAAVGTNGVRPIDPSAESTPLNTSLCVAAQTFTVAPFSMLPTSVINPVTGLKWNTDRNAG